MNKKITALLATTLCLSFSASAFAQSAAVPSKPTLPTKTTSSTPTIPTPTSITKNSKVIYGTDNRVEAVKSSKLSLAKSTVALMDSSVLIPDANFATNKKYNFYPSTFRSIFGVCKTERFAEQPVLAFCSGALIAPNLVLTAGHCITDDTDCANTKFVFDYRVASNGANPTSTVESNVYSCKGIVNRDQTNTFDFAVIELDRNVPGRTPIDFELNLNVALKENVFVIGHPSGLPTKVGTTGAVRSTNPEFFTSNLDTYGGNSGSPVFNKYNRLVGVLVRGENDFVFDFTKGCYKSNVCPSTGCSGEESTQIKAIVRSTPMILKAGIKPRKINL
jgi:S1-C subfamily serine protease